MAQTGMRHDSRRVTENHCGQNMISLLDSQLLVMNASQRRAKYAERPSPCQTRGGCLTATQMLPPPDSHTRTVAHTRCLPWPLPISDCIDLFWQCPFVWMDAQLILACGLSEPKLNSPVLLAVRAAGRVARSPSSSEGIVASGALIIVFSHSQPICRCVKVHRKKQSDVTPQQYCAFKPKHDRNAPGEPQCQSFVFCS